MADTEHLFPVFWDRLAGWMERVRAESGLDVYVISGARASYPVEQGSPATQAYLYRCFQTKRCNNGNPANPPETSWHEWGDGIRGGRWAMAADVYVGDGGANQIARWHHLLPEFGLAHPIPEEVWHIAPIEVAFASRNSAGAADAALRFADTLGPQPVVDDDPFLSKGFTVLVVSSAVRRYIIESDCSGGARPAAIQALDIRGGLAAVADGAPLQQWPGNGQRNQRFIFLPQASLADGTPTYAILADHSGRCLSVALNDRGFCGKGSPVRQYTYDGSSQQRWYISAPDAAGRVMLVSCHADEETLEPLAMDVTRFDETPGAVIVLWAVHGGANQRMKLY